MEVLSFTEGNDQQGEPPSDPVGCLYRDVLTKDGASSPETSQEGSCRAESEPSADSHSGNSQSGEPFNRQPEPEERNTSRSLPSESRSDVGRPPPAAPQQIHIHQPIRSLCGAVGAGSEGPLTVTGAIETISDEQILQDREPEEGIRNMPRFQNYQPGIPSRVSAVLSFNSHKGCVAMETRPACLSNGLCLQVLCVKNLSRHASVAQLVALFSRFERGSRPPVLYRLLTGRMKGQAFITLPGQKAMPPMRRDAAAASNLHLFAFHRC